ncbi:copper chaperone PCu(A)C [Streptomyces sp. NPDC002403]
MAPPPTRLRASVAAVGVPLLACGLALAGLVAWTAGGRAGTPPDVAVTEAYVFQPLGTTPETAAFFTLTNDGGSADRLIAVTSPDTAVQPVLSRHHMTSSGAAYRRPVDSAAVPARGGLTMAPHGIDVTVRPLETWRPGERVAFTLHFAHRAPVTVEATVVRPGTVTA